ncbi:MAG: putative DNA-binding domain-containing protein [Rhodospirillaceae bacterium]|nr:putative DNA-binding domain-containing protein [Rhodospirillaceae bacterium]
MLREVQRSVRTALLGGDPAAAEALVAGNAVAAAERLLVHRNNAQLSLIGVLAADFPVTRRIVGADFFTAMARQFVFAHPPLRPELLAYGGELPDFIAGFPPARPLPYLADVARLEAAVKGSYFAADAVSLRPADLAGLQDEVAAELVLALHPSVRIVASPFPILTLHRANRADRAAVGRVDTTAPGETVLVSRIAAEVTLDAIGPGDAAFLTAVGAGRPLIDAAAAACLADPAFDLQASLTLHLVHGTFAGTGSRGWPHRQDLSP